MRGIVLAGGTGSRLGALTKAVNKHLLPVGGYPMIHWPLKLLEDNDIDDITIVSSARGVGQLAELLGGDFTYRVQDRPGGIAHALSCAWTTSKESVVVILGDNVFLPTIELPICVVDGQAICFLKGVSEWQARELGVARFGDNGGIISVEEKPLNPPSYFAVTGLYMFGPDVFDRITSMHYSARGELEISDLLNKYADEGNLDHEYVQTFWGDAGTPTGIAVCAAAIKDWESQ